MFLQERRAMHNIKFHISLGQRMMKQQASKHHLECGVSNERPHLSQTSTLQVVNNGTSF